jgi:hypothetical protein
VVNKESVIADCLRRKVLLTCGPAMSAKRRERQAARARANWARRLAGRDARPRRNAGKRGSEDGPRAREAGGPRAIGGCWAELGQKLKERKIPFLFLF